MEQRQTAFPRGQPFALPVGPAAGWPCEVWITCSPATARKLRWAESWSSHVHGTTLSAHVAPGSKTRGRSPRARSMSGSCCMGMVFAPRTKPSGCALQRAGRGSSRCVRTRALGALLDEVQPSDLSPLLHADHTLLLARSQDQARVRDQPDASDSTPGGPVFNRRRWSSIQAAPTACSSNARDQLPS
jgi:hypothetical protein